MKNGESDTISSFFIIIPEGSQEPAWTDRPLETRNSKRTSHAFTLLYKRLLPYVLKCYSYLFQLLDQLGYPGWIGCEYRPAGKTVEGLGWFNEFKK
jgi:hypothetical protein